MHAGANWQTGSIVAGLEGDLSFTDIKASSFNSVVNNIGGGIVSSGQAAVSGTFDLLGSGRGRLGYLVSPNVLLYGTGGLAWTRYTENTDLSDLLVAPGTNVGEFSSVSTTTWRLGWVAGLGVEARLFDTNWLARLEYLHYDFGNTGSSSAPAAGFLPVGTLATRSSGDLTLDVVRAGLSYKFDPDRFASYAPATSGGGLLYKAPAPAVAAWSWSGFYVGAHAGYGWARDPFANLLFLDVVTLSGVDSRGFVGGFQTGANWQSGRVVGGLELDLSGTDIKGSTSNSVAVPGILSQASQSDKFDRLGLARARIGYLATPSVLLYATGGPGWARLVTDQETALTVPLATPPVTATSLVTPKWVFGWTAGAGVETRLWDSNWLARIEYLHYDFGSGGPSVVSVPAGPVAGLTSGHLTSDVVRAGLSYKLDWPGMASAGPAAMPIKAAPAAVWSWTGFYIGGHGGYGWGRDPSNQLIGVIIFPSVTPPVFSTGPNSQGGVGGFQAGANWQSGAVVGGLELDLSATGIKGSSTTPVGSIPMVTQTDKFDLLGSARARLGYLVSPSVLLYGTGGLAWTQLDQSLASTFGGSTTTVSTPSWKFGWTAGAGAQARLWNSNWIARLEYLHYDFGDSGASFSGFTDTGVINFLTASMTSHHLTTDVVRAGVDYKLD